MPAARAQHVWAIILCNLLAVLFALVAWTAASGKSYTPDEPGHTLDGWFIRFHADYRFWCNNPPLWEYFIALPATADAIQFDPRWSQYRDLNAVVPPPFWSHRVPLWLMRRARFMCLILGVALALLIGHWAWELAGIIPAIAAVFLYCLDPNFLGHASLVKNDVACALVFVGAARAMWKIGEGITVGRAIGVAIWITAAVLVKFSGLLLAPALVATLGLRALAAQPWPALGTTLARRSLRSAAAGAICLSTFVAIYVGIWASYGFRFNAGPDDLSLPVRDMTVPVRVYGLYKKLHRQPTDAEVAAAPVPAAARFLVDVDRHHLLPQAFTAGLLFTEVFDQGGEEGYLMGQRYYGGKWIYFPLGFLFKEPLASIIGVCLALIVGVHASVRRQLATFQNQWAAICLSVPAGIYALAAITSEMNIGFRHFFPVLPFLYIGTGLAVAAIWRRRAGRIAVVILALALAAETAAAYPDFIAFFNRAAWGQRAWLLSDSNLDWGQDLPALAAWQARNPGVTIYLDFFGHDIPEAYGVHAVDLNDLHGPFRPARPAVAAVSLSLLQLGGYNADALRQLGVDLHSRPIAILGGTICLFAVP